MSSSEASVSIEAAPAGAQSKPAPTHRFLRALPAARVQGLSAVLRLRRLIKQTFLMLIALVLLFWLYQFFVAERHKPLLIIGGASFYKSGAIPANSFAHNDLQRLLETPQFDVRSAGGEDGLIASTAELIDLFDSRLATINHHCLVVYLSVQAVSDSTGAYLIGPDSTGIPEQGYSIERALQQLARCPSRHKLLVLDVARHPINVELGQLGSDFVYCLRRAFERLRQEDTASLAVLCAADDGQRAWSSPCLRHSVFGLCTGYCFHGGPEADWVREGGDNNRVTSASEYARFVQERVAAWALQQRQAVQIPVFLLKGKDFPIVTVSPRLTPMAFAVTVKSRTDRPEEEPEDAPSPTPTTEQPTVSSPSRKQLAAALAEAWAQHAALWQEPATGHHALLRSVYQRQLLRAQQLLLAGEESAAGTILSRDLPAILEASRQRPPATVGNDWTVARKTGPAIQLALRQTKPAEKVPQPRPASVEVLVEATLETPSPEHLAAIDEASEVEAQRVTGLARTLANDGRWLAPDAVRLAIGTRCELEQLAWRVSAATLPIVYMQLQRTERDCQAAEIALALGRIDEATTRLHEVRRACQSLAGQLGEIEQQLTSLERFLNESLYLVQWLGHRPIDSAWHIDLTQVRSVLQRLAEIADWPTPDELRYLAKQVEQVSQRVELSAGLAWQHESWAAAEAVLQVPSLQPARRRQLVGKLLDQQEPGPWQSSFRSSGRDPQEAPASPLPLTVFVPALAHVSRDLEQSLARLDPSAMPPITQYEMSDPAAGIRERRAVAGEQVLRLAEELRSLPLKPVEARSSWLRWLRAQLAAPWRCAVLAQFDPKSLPITPESRQQERELLQWRLARQLDNLTLLPDWKPAVIEKLLQSARKLEPELTVDPPEPHVTLATSRTVTVPTNAPVRWVMQLSCVPSLPATTSASLVLDWFVDRDRLSITLAGEEERRAVNGQLLTPITLTSGATTSIELVARQIGPPGTAMASKATARVVFADGHVEWLPLQLQLDGKAPKPAELLFQWPSQAGLSDRLDLLAGQRGTLSIAVRQHHPKIPNLRLEFQTAGSLPVTVPIAEKQASGLFPVTSTQDLELPIENGELRLRLLSKETLLDARTLLVNVIDPTSCFKPNIKYDPQRGTVAVQMLRIARSDSLDPVPVQLAFVPPLAAKGKLQARLGPKDASCSLMAQLPGDFAAWRFTSVVSVGDFPRAFRFWLGAPWPLGVLRDDPTLHLPFPPDGARFALAPGQQSLPVHLQADSIGPGTLALGFDQNGNGELDIAELIMRRSLMRGRDVRVQLSNKNEKRVFEVSTSASDLQATVPVAGLSGRQTLIGQLTTGTQTVVAQSTIHFLSEAPPLTIDIPQPATMLAVKQPLAVVVRAEPDQAGLIDAVVLGFDKNGNLELDEGEAVIPLDVKPPGTVTLTSAGLASIRLPTTALPAGVHTLLVHSKVRVRDESAKKGYRDLIGPAATRNFTISAALAPPGGVITGVVSYGGQAASGAKVAIAPLKREATADREGKFRLANVPAGKYELTARLYKRAGKVSVTVKSNETTTTELALKLDVK